MYSSIELQMAKTIITIQSADKRDIDLFFDLIGERVGKRLQRFEAKGTHTAMFEIDFRELQKIVTNGNENVTKKQDLSKNSNLCAVVGLYRKSGLSFQKIADKLNAEGYTNSRNRKFNKMQVSRLYDKYMQETKKELLK